VVSRDVEPTQRVAVAAPWQATAATARGSSHVRSGLPNQDAAQVREVPEAGAVVVAVADGHGGARYVRSDLGAAYAVTIACELGAAFAVARAGERDRAVQRRAAMELVPQLVDRWTAAVHQHAAQHPFVDEERARAGVDLDEDVPFAYGATLLFVVAAPGWVLVGQLGDGDVIVVDRVGDATRPVPRDSRLVAGQTTSLCLPDAPRDLRLTVLPAEAVDTLVLASDGYGNSFASADWWQAVGRDMQAQLRERGLESVTGSLPEWAADSADVGGDDVTIAILARDASAGPPPVADTVPVPVEAEPSSRAPKRTRRGRRRFGLAMVALVVLALVAGAVAFAVTGDGSDADDDVAAPSTSTPVAEAPDGTTIPPAQLGDRAALRVTSPTDAVTWVATSPYTVSGSVDPTSRVALVTNGGDPVEVAVGADGTWSHPVDLVEIENVVQITVTDRRPELDPRTEERRINYDPTRPTVTVDSPSSGSVVDGAVEVRGHADPLSDIYNGDQKVAETGFGDTWGFTVTVTGDVTLRITAHDRIGPGEPVTIVLRHHRPTTTTSPPSTSTTSPPEPTPTTTPVTPPPITAPPVPSPGGGGGEPSPGGQTGPTLTLPPEICARTDLPDDVRRTRCP
jgi:serine/threonine protein phosphatase PrpC